MAAPFRTLVPALMLAIWSLAPAPSSAQQSGYLSPATLAVADLPSTTVLRGPAAVANVTARRPPLAEPPAELRAERDRVVGLLERFSGVPAAAWPAVRDYIWTRCFAGQDTFAAYAYSHPGAELDDAVVFSLFLDRGAWERLDEDDRKHLVRAARSNFGVALAELGVGGELEFMLASGMR